MPAREYRYFIAKGRSLAICQEAIRLREEASAKLAALYPEVGSQEARVGSRVAGFIFRDKPPEGWVNSLKQDRHCYLPNKKFRHMRDLHARIAELYWPDGHWLAGKFGGGETWTSEVGRSYSGFTGNVILYPVYEILASQLVIRMPINEKGEWATPPDAEPIKTSQYWVMREAEDEKPAEPEREHNPRIRLTNQDLYVDGRWVAHIWVSGNHYGTHAAGQNFAGRSLRDVAEQVLAALDGGSHENQG